MKRITLGNLHTDSVSRIISTALKLNDKTNDKWSERSRFKVIQTGCLLKVLQPENTLKTVWSNVFINQFGKYLLIGNQKKRMFCHVEVKISSKDTGVSHIALFLLVPRSCIWFLNLVCLCIRNSHQFLLTLEWWLVL